MWGKIVGDPELEWMKKGKSVTSADVEQLESGLGVAFPSAFKNFLIAVNGGVPSRRMFVCDENRFKISHFYALKEISKRTEQFRSELDLPTNVIPIALVDEDILILNGGRIQLWWMIESGFEEGRLSNVAESFHDFLQMLQKKLPKSIYEKFGDAINDSNAGRLKQLLDEGVDVNDRGRGTFIDQAFYGADWKILELLLEAGGSRTLSNGDSVEGRLRGKLAGEIAVIELEGAESKYGVEASAAVEQINQVLQRFFS